MAYRNKRNISVSETSEDPDDPPPVEDTSWYSHASNDASMRRSQDLPEGPGFMTDEDSDDDEGPGDLPDVTSPLPAPRARGLSSFSDGSDCIKPAAISQRGLSSLSDESDGTPAKITHRGFSSQSEDADYAQFSYPGSVNSQSMTTLKEADHTRRGFDGSNLRKRGLSSLSTSTSADSADTDQDDDGPPAKKRVSTAVRIMAAMGYQEGKGLGKHEQGRVEPVAASNQKGKRGLGFEILALGTPGLKFDPSQETVSVEESIEWVPRNEDDPPTAVEMKGWMQIGRRKRTIDDESTFCDKVVLSNVLNAKSVFDALDGKELMKARSRANPFEQIRGVFFLNRAAMKMANMDAVFGFMFTTPRDADGNELLGPHDLLYFADVCAGPGGFTEYVLWKRQWKAKGIGFTLKGPCDFKLEDFFAAPSETFEPYYGVNDDGNVYTPTNIESLENRVKTTMDPLGVHFMMADGGFSVEGQENIQEVLSKRLYLCQCLVALKIVRPGGHFVVKLFDVFTPFSIGLLYLMYRCFANITIHKPNTSRPANSERYLICKCKRENCDDVIKYMMNVNKTLDKLEKTDEDVTEIVPLNILTQVEKEFYDFMVWSNNTLGQRQVVQLLKIAAFCEDPQMIEMRQNVLRKECLQLYKVPDKPRAAPQDVRPATLVSELLGRPIDKVMLANVQKQFKRSLVGELRDWLFCPIGSLMGDDIPQPTLIVGLGGARVYRLEARDRWMQIPNLELPRRTLLLGELISECEGGRGNQKKMSILHIIDAACLGGEDLRSRSLSERTKLCKMFATAIRGNTIHAKHLYETHDLPELCINVECREKKNGERCLAIPNTDNERRFIIPGGLLFLSKTHFPWIRAYSASSRREYFYNTSSKASYYETPKDAIATFDWTFNNLQVWWWDNGVKMRHDQTFPADEAKLQPEDLLQAIHKNKMKDQGR